MNRKDALVSPEVENLCQPARGDRNFTWDRLSTTLAIHPLTALRVDLKRYRDDIPTLPGFKNLDPIVYVEIRSSLWCRWCLKVEGKILFRKRREKKERSVKMQDGRKICVVLENCYGKIEILMSAW